MTVCASCGPLSARRRRLLAAFIVQNLEEILFLPDWAARHAPLLATGTARFALATAALTLLAGLALWHDGRRGRSGLTSLVAGVLLANACTHIAVSVWTFSLMPGAVSGLLLQGPAAGWLLAGLPVSPHARLGAVALGLALIPPLAAASLALAGLFVV